MLVIAIKYSLRQSLMATYIVLMLINLGVGIYNIFVLLELFARQANTKDKLLYLEIPQ